MSNPRSEKTEFVKAVARRLGVSRDAAAKAVDGVFALLAEGLREHGQVPIWGVGRFEVLDVPVPPRWRTPVAGAVASRRGPKVIRLRPARVYRDRLG